MISPGTRVGCQVDVAAGPVVTLRVLNPIASSLAFRLKR